MLVTQIKDLVNEAAKEALGIEGLVNEDLTNVVDAGKTIESSTVVGANPFDHYVKKLINQIGKMIFVDYTYEGELPSLRKDGWLYGSILMKTRADMPKADETEDWQLTDGSTYDPNQFYQPTVHAKFFNKRVTFTVPMSITEMQIRESFQSAQQLNSFVSMIYTAINNSLTIATENLAKRCVNNAMAETIYTEYPTPASSTPYGDHSGVRAINLLYLYNTRFPTAGLTAANCLEDKEFIRFASSHMKKIARRLRSMSTVFNIGGTEKFTPKSRLHIVLHADFADSADAYLYSDTFHNEFVKLPMAETVNYWQGSGTDFGFASTSKINVKTSENHTVEIPYILGCMFDDNAAMVTNENNRVTSNYNPVGEFYNSWHKQDAQYLNDFEENFVVFFCADASEED